MSTRCIYMLGSTRVHKHLHCPCMPECGSESWTLHIYACVCICETCERCLLMELSVMKIVEVDFVVVWIFCSFNDVFVSSWVYKCLWGLIGLLRIITTAVFHVEVLQDNVAWESVIVWHAQSCVTVMPRNHLIGPILLNYERCHVGVTQFVRLKHLY